MQPVSGIPSSYSLAVTPDFIHNVVYVISDNKLYSSTDGNSFKQVESFLPLKVAEVVLAPDNTIYVRTDHGLYYSTDGNSFKQIAGFPSDKTINQIITAPYQTVYAITTDGYIYTSTAESEFKLVSGIPPAIVKANHIVIKPNGIIYSLSGSKVWFINPNHNLIDDLFTTSDKPFVATEAKNGYSGWVFNQPQMIATKTKYLASARIDNLFLPNPSSFVLGTTDPADPTHKRQLPKHQLILTFKEQYKQFALFFDGNPTTGVVTFPIWIKTNVKDINYFVTLDITLKTNLTGKDGNVDGCPVITTMRNDGYTQFPAPLTINAMGDDQKKMIDYSKSYYVAGTVDVTTNNFTATGQHQPVADSFYIATNGIYKLVFTDYVGSQYISYLELGKDNHIINTKDPNAKGY